MNSKEQSILLDAALRAGFEDTELFCPEHRAFIARKRQPLPEPPPLHRELGQHRFCAIVDNGSEIVIVTSAQLADGGWRK